MKSLTTNNLQKKVEDLERRNKILSDHLKRSAEERNDFLTKTLNTMGDPVFVKDAESRLLLVNDAFCNMFKLERSDIIGKTLAEHVPPEERDSFLAIDRQVIADGKENVNEETLTLPGQKTHTISTKKSRFLDASNNPYLVGIIRDISDRIEAEKQLRISEEQFRSLFTQSQFPSALLNLDQQIIKCNQAFCDFLKFPKEALLGKRLQDFAHPDDEKQDLDPLLIQSDTDHSRIIEKRFVQSTGELRWGEITISIIRDTESRSVFFLPMIQDITKRHAAFEALKSSQLQLKELNRTKDKMFSVIAHDLRGPLGSMLGLSELLTEEGDLLNEKDRKIFFSSLNDCIKSTNLLLNNLLSWANCQRGQIQPNYSSLPLGEIIREVFRLLQNHSSTKNIRLISNVPEKLEITTDKDILGTIVRNLVSNALKYTHSGGKVEIQAKSYKNQIELCVNDDGIGMSKDKCEKLFKLDSNRSTPGTENEKGSGLGLLLVHEFVAILGGSIEVQSTINKGTSFIIHIPTFPKA